MEPAVFDEGALVAERHAGGDASPRRDRPRAEQQRMDRYTLGTRRTFRWSRGRA